jgi:hypothetical protein
VIVLSENAFQRWVSPFHSYDGIVSAALHGSHYQTCNQLYISGKFQTIFRIFTPSSAILHVLMSLSMDSSCYLCRVSYVIAVRVSCRGNCTSVYILERGPVALKL